MNKYCYCLLFVIIIFSTCKEYSQDHITQLVEEWQGKEVRFPENPVFTRQLVDTVNFRIPEAEYKVLVYVDSIGCTSCKLQLPKWYQLQIAITQVERIYRLCRFGQWRTGSFPVFLPIERQQGIALYFEAG